MNRTDLKELKDFAIKNFKKELKRKNKDIESMYSKYGIVENMPKNKFLDINTMVYLCLSMMVDFILKSEITNNNK